MKVLRSLGGLLTLCLVVMIAVPASASMTQEFRQNNLGPYDSMEFFITSTGTEFDSPGITGFHSSLPSGADATWGGTTINPEYLYASGDEVTTLRFYLHFIGNTNPMTFDVLTYNGSTLLEAVGATYDGSWSFIEYDLNNFDPDTYDRTATPIPAAIWLLGSGLVGLVGVRRKMKA